MQFKTLFVVVMVMLAITAGCTPETENGNDANEERGLFERRNTTLDPAQNEQSPRKVEHAFARIALSCINRQYPNKISHVMTSARDVAEPVELTPVFYGCFDWHSAVHGHWLLVRLWGQHLVPEMDAEIEAALNSNFTPEKIAGEVDYFNGEDRGSFERPYGLAWFLQLMAEIREISENSGPKAEQAKIWLEHFKPLETIVEKRISDWIPKLAYPIRLGTHNQSAFAFGLFIDWARTNNNDAFEALIIDKSLAFHKNDRNCPLAYEPSGEDFLSPCLMTADLMRRVLPPDEFAVWLEEFLPQIPTDGSGDWLPTGVVNDPSDGKLVHLDGVNLSRAWALEGIASVLAEDNPRRPSLLAAAKIHGDAGKRSVSTPHYAGSHWLASFASYLETQRGIVTENRAPAGAID